jgi:hypothetical protein
MNDAFERRVHAAAVAGWWTLLIAVLVVTVQWIAYLICSRVQPVELIAMWGPHLAWSEIQRMWIWAILIIKLGIFIAALVVVWLTLWSRQLRKANDA